MYELDSVDIGILSRSDARREIMQIMTKKVNDTFEWPQLFRFSVYNKPRMKCVGSSNQTEHSRRRKTAGVTAFADRR